MGDLASIQVKIVTARTNENSHTHNNDVFSVIFEGAGTMNTKYDFFSFHHYIFFALSFWDFLFIFIFFLHESHILYPMQRESHVFCLRRFLCYPS